MKYNCDMISDLLPLYIDNACSQSSKEAIEQHLSECEACSRLCEEMKKSEVMINSSIVKEREEVLTKQAKFFKRRSAIAGCIIGAIFAIPILVSLIVNIASGAGLTWFFIVLAAMFIPTSLIVVPLMAVEDKFFWTITSFTASLILLLGVCCIYSGGSWFFIAAPSVLFGLSIPFMPFVVTAKPVAKRIGNNKLLLLVSTYTFTYLLMMISIGVLEGSSDFAKYAVAYSIMPILFMWALFVIIRLPKWHGLIKAAVCILVSSLIFFFNDTVVLLILDSKLYIPSPAFNFDTYENSNGTLCWSVLIAGIILSAVLGTIGLKKSKSSNKREISK